MQSFVHYFLHLIFPCFIAWVFFRKNWKHAYLIMLATMLVDADHLLANPIFQPDRCSINFHPLHTYYAMLVYTVFLFVGKTWRIIGIGLLLHMITDLLDCLWMFRKCKVCYIDDPAYELLEKLGSFF